LINQYDQAFRQTTDGLGNVSRSFMQWQSRWFGAGTLYAGPFRRMSEGSPIMSSMVGINMAKEIPGGDYRVEVGDFDVPEAGRMLQAILYCYAAHQRDLRVYIGCMGGVGRTGTFLACWMKVVGARDPVGYVREHYNSHACETKAQERFVRDFPVWAMRWYWLTHRVRMGAVRALGR